MSLQRLQVPPAAAPVRRVRGVTLIELLVVVGIIAILIAIVVPSIGHVKALAKKAAVQQQLAGLSTALENYFQEFKVFPPSEVLDSSGTAMPAYAGNIKIGRGSALLAEGLMGYLPAVYDGAGPSMTGDPTYGFRMHGTGTNASGKIYGPYGPEDPKYFVDNNPAVPNTDRSFVDVFGHEILYFRSTRSGGEMTGMPPVTQVFGTNTAANNYYFYTNANSLSADLTTTRTDPSTSPAFLKLLGAPSNSIGGVAANVVGHDTFLLVSAGPDGVYFTADDIVYKP